MGFRPPQATALHHRTAAHRKISGAFSWDAGTNCYENSTMEYATLGCDTSTSRVRGDAWTKAAGCDRRRGTLPSLPESSRGGKAFRKHAALPPPAAPSPAPLSVALLSWKEGWAGLSWAGRSGAPLPEAGRRPPSGRLLPLTQAGRGRREGRALSVRRRLGEGRGGVLAPSFERGGRAASAGEAGPPRVWGDAEAAVLPEGGKCPVCGSALRWELPVCLGEGGRGASLLPLEDSTPLCVVVVGGRLPLPPFSSQPARGFAVTGLPGLGLGARPRPLRPLGVTRWRPHRQRSVRGRLPGRSCLPSVDRSLRLLKRTSEAI